MKFVIGDTHGCIFTLKRLLRKIRKIEKKPDLFFVGDYVDRGMHSKELLDYLISLQKKGAVCIRGNHDDVVDYIVNDHSESSPSEWVSLPPTTDKIVSWWMRNGFDTTCTSYGLTLPPVVYGPYGARVSGPDGDLVVQQLKESMPQSHKDFLRNLKMWHEDEKFFLFHGWFDYYKELPIDFKFLHQTPNEWMWGRFSRDFIAGIPSSAAWDKIGIFGHTPVSFYGFEKPFIIDDLVLLDVGGFMGKGLAAYCVETNSIVFAESDKRDLHSKWRT